MQTEVLIVGAGPSGLVLALGLARAGVRVRIIDRAPGAAAASRAFALQARTLELYDRLGLAKDAVARGRTVGAMTLHLGRGWVQTIPFGDFGRGLSPYPFVLMLLQGDHEKLLIDHLAAAGVSVERSTQLIDLHDDGETVRARLMGPAGDDDWCEARFVCGCDGFGSVVRALADIGFPGQASEELFYVADLQAKGAVADGQLHYLMAGEDLCSVFPLRGAGRIRLIGLTPASVRQRLTEFDFEDVAPSIEAMTDLKVSMVEAFAVYPVHQRTAATLRKGGVFLLGEAGHVHSPAGGQGLNAGAGDAVNLAWKLAAVLRQAADPRLLDTFEAERMSAAVQVAVTTDRGFILQARHGRWMGLARGALARLAPRLMRLSPFRLWVFRTLSQLAIGYRDSAACAGRAGRIAGGDRLPWVCGDGDDNFGDGLAWSAHVYGEPRPDLEQACLALGLALREFPWSPAAARAGLARHALYLVRPDGYVALASGDQDASALRLCLQRFKIDPARPPGA